MHLSKKLLDEVRSVTFSFSVGLSLLNLPHTHREIDCYFLVFFMGLFPAESPMYAPRNPGLIEKVSPCRPSPRWEAPIALKLVRILLQL
eukprot:SAG31_NODE_1609_length_7753_cov_12.390253_4_plen_89_part_00